MLHKILDELTPDARRQLDARGITAKRIWSWRDGERLPTEVQVADLADVTGADWSELQKEITVLRAPEERREQIARAISWRRR